MNSEAAQATETSRYTVAPGSEEFHEKFLASDRPHALMITNHGIHQWKIIPGLPDTGGQNVFVNFFTDALTQLGYRVTIVNRGGFAHPATDELQKGIHYKSEAARLLYLEDGTPAFIRKEDMGAQLPELVQELYDFVQADVVPVDFICSHYWDAAVLGASLNDKLASVGKKVKHVWVPHSLGAVKKDNVDPSRWEELRIEERINTEKEVIGKLDGVAATSDRIKESLAEDYDCPTEIFLPPCVDVQRYSPAEVPSNHELWTVLTEQTGLDVESLKKRTMVTEVSRTDKTKAKDILIQAFAKAKKENPELLLLLTLDKNQAALYAELTQLIEAQGIKDSVVILGSVWDLLPAIYRVTDIYCTPSVMEGFGMSIQEAAATGVPAVSSDLVPFAVEYLAGKEQVELSGVPVKRGEGCYIVKANDIEGFATAISELASDPSLRQKMGANALKITVPYFTWTSMTQTFLKQIGLAQ